MTVPPVSHILRVADLPTGKATQINLSVAPENARDLAQDMGITDARKLSLRGKLAPLGRRDWRFEGTLGATVVQPCVVTLEPVTTRLDVPVERTWIAGYVPNEVPGESEMVDDDTVDPLEAEIDLGLVLAEALALALPDYPRKDGAAVETTGFAAPGIAPMTDEDAKPFAGLAALRDSLGTAGEGEDSDGG